MDSQTDRGRGSWGLILCIALGLAIGFFIKKVHIGLLLGLIIGLIASVFMRRR
jgi:hypothetical protein